MAQYDEPAMIDYVINKTNQSKITYVAHSEGTTLMFAALADRLGNFTEKLNLFVAFAPAVYIREDADEWFKKLSEWLDPSELSILHKFGIYELLGASWDKKSKMLCKIFSSFCHKHSIIKVLPGPNVDSEAAAFANSRNHSSISVK